MTTERPLTKEELCDFLQASCSTIDQYNREGMSRFYVGKECRYIPSKVLEWLERRSQHRVLSTGEAFEPRKELAR
jgi:predicted DNA-binding transcriptional regulator AlpA